MLIRLFAAAVAFALCTASAARADEKDRTLALAAVTPRGAADADEADEMSDALTSALVADGRLALVERQELQRVMKEQALSQSGAISPWGSCSSALAAIRSRCARSMPRRERSRSPRR
jgi:hypothetical protein